MTIHKFFCLFNPLNFSTFQEKVLLDTTIQLKYHISIRAQYELLNNIKNLKLAYVTSVYE